MERFENLYHYKKKRETLIAGVSLFLHNNKLHNNKLIEKGLNFYMQLILFMNYKKATKFPRTEN